MLRFALYPPCKDLTFILHLERKKIHNMAEKWGYIKPSLTTSAHCCQGVCQGCLAGSLTLLTRRCVIPIAQVEFWWLNWCSKAYFLCQQQLEGLLGDYIRIYVYTDYICMSNICIYGEKLKYIQAYSPFCITKLFSLVLFDLVIFNSLIWKALAVSSGTHFEFTRPTFCRRGKKAAALVHEGPGFKASLGIFTSAAIKDSCKSTSLWLPGRRFSLKEGNWSTASVRQMQGGTLRMAAALADSMKCSNRPPEDFLTWLFYIYVWWYCWSNITRCWICLERP